MLCKVKQISKNGPESVSDKICTGKQLLELKHELAGRLKTYSKNYLGLGQRA
jgi:hypothetical protein